MKPKREKDYDYIENIQDLDQIVEGKLPKRSQFMDVEISKNYINECYVKQNEEDNLIDTRIQGNYKYPNSAIGLIKKDDQLVGTGFLIRDNIVMTCAHNFYCRQTSQKGQKYQGLTFHIGGEKEKRISYKIKNQNVYYPKQYETVGFESGKQEERFLYDYAVFKLQNTTNGQYGTLGVKFCTQVNQFKAQQTKHKKVTISGYPYKTLAKNQKQKQKQKNEKGRQQNSTQKKEMQKKSQLIQKVNKDQHIYHQEGQIKELDESLMVFKYQITTTSGQSGSPIFEKGNNGKYYVRGIHIHGDQKDRINRGVILDDVKRNQINIWIGQSTGILNFRNQNWLQVLKTQEFKLINLLTINRVSADDFSQITQQKIIEKLKKLEILQIGLQLSNFSQIIKTCNKIKSLKQVMFHIFESNGQEIQTQQTDQIEESNYLRTVIVYQKKDIIKVIKSLQKKYIKRLYHNQITQLSSEIGNLKNLQTLNLSSNKITQLPIEIGNLMNLQVLDLYRNQITQLSSEIGNLKNLQTLNLSSNKITQLPIEIGNLVNLQTLILSNNQITQLPIEIGNLENLQVLDLQRNQITQLPIEIGNLENLQVLDLQRNQITQLPIEIGNLMNLQTLNLSSNKITQLPIEIGNLKNLQTLNLSNNQITQLPIEIGNLKNLIELDISYNELEYINPKAIQLLVNVNNKLEKLNIQHNKLKSLPTNFCSLTNPLKKPIMLNLGQNPLLTQQVLEKALNFKKCKRKQDKNKIDMENPQNYQKIKNANQNIKSQLITILLKKFQKIIRKIKREGESKKIYSIENNTLNISQQNFDSWEELKQIENLKILNANSLGIEQLAEIGNLVNLQTLNLQNNQITQLPSEIGNLVNLQTLILSNNQIIQLPSEIGNLVKLQTLILYQNKVTQLPIEIKNLKNLQVLSLHQNKITELPIEIGNLENLQVLDLQRNQITQLPSEIGNLMNLQTLILTNNQITQLPIEIGNLMNLQALILYQNKVTQLPIEIGNLMNLQVLDLYHNQITQLSSEIGNLVNLQTLNLSSNKIKQLPMEIGNLVNLQKLYIGQNLRANIPFQLLSKLKNILC